MEQQNSIQLNEQAIDALRESAKWSMFLAIMGFIGIGFMVLAGIFMGSTMAMIPSDVYRDESTPFGAIGGWISALYIIIAALYFVPVYYLFKYASEMKSGLSSYNSDAVSNALVNLKSHHKFLGVSIIVIISLYILMIIGFVLFFAAAATS